MACRTARPPGRWRRSTTGNVGAPVAATDSKAAGTPEALQYSLSGTDMSSFKVDNNGQIAVGSGTKLDYEGKRDLHGDGHRHGPLGRILLHPRDH